MNNVTKWVNSTLKKSSSTSSRTSAPATYNQSWLHSPEALTNAYVEFVVRYLGDAPVQHPKGTQVIKDAIRQLRFQLDLKRSRGVYKLPKIELHVSVKGVKMVDPKSRMLIFTHPLHRISFCADDKHDKRLFAFIAKVPRHISRSSPWNTINSSTVACSDSDEQDEHRCFVFFCDKLAEHITLTIGEAFDLAYRQFLDGNNTEDSNNETQLKRLVELLRKRIKELERENNDLKVKLAAKERHLSKDQMNDDRRSIHSCETSSPLSEFYYKQNEFNSGCHVAWESFEPLHPSLVSDPPLPSSPVPPPPRNINPGSDRNVSDCLDEGCLSNKGCSQVRSFVSELPNNGVFDPNFDPRADELLKSGNDFSNKSSSDASFNTIDQTTCDLLAREIERREALLAEMREGYKRGLCIGRCTDLEDDQQSKDPLSDSFTPSFTSLSSAASQNSTTTTPTTIIDSGICSVTVDRSEKP